MRSRILIRERRLRLRASNARRDDMPGLRTDTWPPYTRVSGRGGLERLNAYGERVAQGSSLR
jgi:hypothetical protein